MHYKFSNVAVVVAFASGWFVLQNSIGLAAPTTKSEGSGAKTSGAKANGAKSNRAETNRAKTSDTKSSAKPKRKISAEQAVALVKKRSDVKKFLALFPNGKSKKTQGFPVVEAEELDNNWNVHVYEQMPDHTATMNLF